MDDLGFRVTGHCDFDGEADERARRRQGNGNAKMERLWFTKARKWKSRFWVLLQAEEGSQSFGVHNKQEKGNGTKLKNCLLT